MKVLIISHTYITKINRDKWKILAHHNPEIQLMVVVPKSWPGHLYTHNAGDIQQENLYNCSFIACDGYHVGNEVKYHYAWKQLYRLIATFKPTILHVEQGASAYSYFQTLICARVAGIKAGAVFFTWINWKHQFSLKYKLFWSFIEKYNLAGSDGAITGNHEAQKILQEQGFTKPIAVIPQLGVNTTIFRPVTEHARIGKTIGYIGRVTEEKGVLLLAQAFSIISSEFPEWKLLFVGSGKAEKTLIDYTVQEKLTDRIEFKSAVSHEEVLPILQQLDVLVLPSYDTPTWKEQFGHILIEAMACGVPVIGSDAGEIPYVIGEAGLIFEQKSCADLVSILCTILPDKNVRKSLSIQGRQRVEEHFSHEIIGEKVIAFWKRITQ